MQIESIYTKAHSIFINHIYKVAPFSVDNVIVPDNQLAFLGPEGFEETLMYFVIICIHCPSDFAFLKHVHLWDLLVLFIYNPVYLVVSKVFSWKKPHSKPGQEIFLFQNKWSEKSSMTWEDVSK